MILKHVSQLKLEPAPDAAELRGEKMLFRNVIQKISMETCYLSPVMCLMLIYETTVAAYEVDESRGLRPLRGKLERIKATYIARGDVP